MSEPIIIGRKSLEYDDMTIGEDGDGKPYVVGEVPHMLGVDRELLAQAESTGAFLDGELTLVGHTFRYVCDDGAHVAVFERRP